MNEVEPGDYVQWECRGMWMFPELMRITDISPCGKFVFVEGTRTGIPMRELVQIRKRLPTNPKLKKTLRTRI